ncbi:MAG: hypothetical protein ABFR97_11025 [Thermodesulfobacteriota bacterium]
MTITCSLHPAKPAHFQCHKCDTTYCGQCVIKRRAPRYGQMTSSYFCPSCDIPAEQLPVGNFIEPFWTRLAKFFTYPVQTYPLILIGILATLTAILPTSLLTKVFCFVVSTKYAYGVLLSTAQGNLKPPKPTVELINSDAQQVFKQYLLFAICGGLSSLIFSFSGIFGAGLFGLTVFLLMPAMIMVLVTTDSVVAALNPMIVVPVVARIGWRYLLVLVFLIFLPAGPAAILHLLPEALPLALIIFLAALLQHYYTFITYNLMGYVLLQYHDEIGYEVDYDHFVTSSLDPEEQLPQDPEQALMQQINVLVKSGRHEEALALIREKSQGREEDVELSEKYFTLLKICQKRDSYISHGPYHLDLLIKKNKKAKAMELYDELKEDGEVKISADSAITIGKWLVARHDYKGAMACLVRFIKANPQHAKLPEAYFPLIQILNEQSNNRAKAAQLAKGVIRNYPDHPLTPRLESYLQAMS